MRIFSNNIDLVIYEIEKQVSGKWYTLHPSERDFDEKWDMHKGNGQEQAPLSYAFSACGECWQKTSIHGTFDANLAALAIGRIILRNPDQHYRLVKRHYRITTTTMLAGGGMQNAA